MKKEKNNMARKILLIVLFIIIGVSINSYVNAIDTNNVVGIQQTNINVANMTTQDMLNSVSTGNKVGDNVINALESKAKDKYISVGSSVGDTYNVEMKDSVGSAIYYYDFWDCAQKGTTIGSGNLIIEKVSCVKNTAVTIRRYAWPSPLYGNTKGGNINGDDRTVKYISIGSKVLSSNNYHGTWNENSPIYGKDDNSNYSSGTGNMIEIYSVQNYTTSNDSAIKAYILATKPKYIKVEDDRTKKYYKKNVRQVAIWNVINQKSFKDLKTDGEIPAGAITEAEKLVEDANEFATYRSGCPDNKKLTKGTKNISVMYKDGYILVGPYQAIWNSDYDELKSVSVEYKKSGSTTDGTLKNCTITDSNGAKISITQSKDFYIKITNSEMQNNGIMEIKRVIANFSETNVYAIFYHLVQEGKDDIQNQELTYQAGFYKSDVPKDEKTSITLIKPLSVEISKTNQKNASLTGATFDVKFVQDGKTLTSTSNTVKPTSTSDIKVTITETKAPNGYSTLSAPIVITYKYDTSKAEWVKSAEKLPQLEKIDINSSNKDGKTTVIVGVEDLAKIDSLTLLKVSSKDDKPVTAKFDITLGNVVSAKLGNSTSGGTTFTNVNAANGKLVLTDIVVENLNNPITVTVKETETEKGYKLLENPITLVITKNNEGNWECSTHEQKTTGDLNFADINGDGIVTKEDVNLILQYSTGKIEINNIYGIGTKGILGDIDNDGNITSADSLLIEKYIEGTQNFTSKQLLVADVNGDGKISKEDSLLILSYSVGNLVDNTYGIGKNINKIVGDLNNDGKVNSADALLISEYIIKTSASAVANGNTIALTIKNTPMMNLGGKVWLDKFNGEYKSGAKRNGTYDSGEKLEGKQVFLYDITKNELVKTDVDGNTLKNNPAITDKNGRYLFERVPVGNYKVVFEKYDGIKYVTVNDSKDNDATEEGRDNLIKKYKTVQNTTRRYDDVKILDDDYITASYTHDYTNDDTWKNTWETGDTLNSDGTIKKGTPNYDDATLNIDCGLQERKFDLSLGTDVDKATVSINGKSTTYTYDQILNGGSTGKAANRFLLGEQVNNGKLEVNYNLNLYTSDYYYRINDYINSLPSYLNSIATNRDKDNYNDINELSVDVTYKILLTNQSVLESKGLDANANVFVTGIKDYFDSNYTLKKVEFKTFTNNQTIDNAVSKSILKENDLQKLVSGNVLDLSGNQTLSEINLGGTSDPAELTNAVIYLTFSVKPDDKGIVALDDMGNLAEITSYSTSTGLIDVDSAPDNCNYGEKLNYEDDTDDAPLLTIGLQEGELRVISGTVFDSNKDETKVNDVIVQLIELKQINGETCEYIWQETRSGNGNVVRMSKSGTSINTYTNSVKDTDTGEYKFTGFIPGDYIVRFIYGDGRVVQTNKDGSIEYDSSGKIKTVMLTGNGLTNTKKYNGQDYKSTKYDNYNSTKYYNEVDFGTNKSVARDNEARRLAVMSYSTTVDNSKGTEISNKTEDMLNKTWMCAETLKINVPVDASDLKTGNSATDAEGEKSGEGNIFSNINFGLELRPKTKLVLEKHITGLKITPNASGATDLLDATVKIEDILDNNVIDTKTGVTKGLSTIVSERQNRGFWKLETDLEELAQGANVEVTYTYVVKNEGDEDYLSGSLISAYKYFLNDNTANEKYLGTTTYFNYLSALEQLVKKQMKTNSNTIGEYLGKYYYTGTPELAETNPDTLVPTRAEEIEEALNNKLSLDSTKVDSMGFKTKQENQDKIVLKDNEVLKGNDTSLNTNVEINMIVKSREPTEILEPNNNDTNKILTLNTTLSSVSTDSAQLTFDSYIAQITKYTNAAGRADMKMVPENLKYVHSDNTGITLADTCQYDSNSDGEDDTPYNEHDEFWGETVIISKPTGEDKLTTVQIIAITTAAVAIVGVGIILIKKYVIKK